LANPNDTVRDAILRHLYDLHRKARGLKGVASKIRDLQSAMKKLGIAQAQVNSNLDYLLQKGWAREVVTSQTFRTPGGTIRESKTSTYKISDIGIDKLEGASAYRRDEKMGGINVTNINGVTVIGDGNVVNTEYTDLARVLDELEEAITGSPTLSNEQRLDVLADVQTLQSQLSKPKPNRSVIRAVWSGVQNVVTGAEFAELVVKATRLLGPLLS